jgi:hypothetical protein
MTYFGILQNFALSFGREFYDIMQLYKELRSYSSTPDETKIKSNPPQNNLYPGFYPDKSYLLRKVQNRDGANKRVRVCQYQKPMLIRMNKEIKGLEIKIEENIQEAFSRKIKSRRWMKRHHEIGRSCSYVPQIQL